MQETRWRKRALPAKLGRRRRRLFYIKVSSLVILFVAMFIGVVFLFRAPGIQVQAVSVVGNGKTAKEDLISIANEVGKGNYLFVFPKSNIALYPREELAGSLLSDFPQLKSASVDTDGLKTLVVSVTERAPVGVWCASVTDAGSCYFLDETGYIYGRAPNFSGPVFMRYLGSVSGEPLRTHYLPEDSFRNLQTFFKHLGDIHLTPTSFTVANEYDYRLDLAEGPYILMAKKDPFDIVLQNLESVLSSDAVRGKISKLEYIDLRFGSKVYYKEK